MSWRIRLEERDGQLVPELHYESKESDYDTRDEYEMARENAREAWKGKE